MSQYDTAIRGSPKSGEDTNKHGDKIKNFREPLVLGAAECEHTDGGGASQGSQHPHQQGLGRRRGVHTGPGGGARGRGHQAHQEGQKAPPLFVLYETPRRQRRCLILAPLLHFFGFVFIVLGLQRSASRS